MVFAFTGPSSRSMFTLVIIEDQCVCFDCYRELELNLPMTLD